MNTTTSKEEITISGLTGRAELYAAVYKCLADVESELGEKKAQFPVDFKISVTATYETK